MTDRQFIEFMRECAKNSGPNVFRPWDDWSRLAGLISASGLSVDPEPIKPHSWFVPYSHVLTLCNVAVPYDELEAADKVAARLLS